MNIHVGNITVPVNRLYRGPGGPDPKKTREEREAELLGMMQTKDGRDIIFILAHEALGVPMGTSLPVGSSMRGWIEAILNHEYKLS